MAGIFVHSNPIYSCFLPFPITIPSQTKQRNQNLFPHSFHDSPFLYILPTKLIYNSLPLGPIIRTQVISQIKPLENHSIKLRGETEHHISACHICSNTRLLYVVLILFFYYNFMPSSAMRSIKNLTTDRSH